MRLRRDLPGSRIVLPLLAGLAAPAPHASAQDVGPVQDVESVLPLVTAGFPTDGWLEPDAPIELLLETPLDPAAGSFAVFLGETDLSLLFETTPRKLSYRRTAPGLPPGESELVVHVVTADDVWQEVARFPIRVRTPTGFEKATFDPRLDLVNEGQVAEGHAPDENRPPRETYQEVTGHSGWTTTHVRDGWTVRSQMNVVGVSHRPKALRFFERGDQAPRVDLSDYRLDVEKGVARGSLGHVTFGGNRHLIQGFGSRGAEVAMRFGSAADLAAAWLHGSSIVGWSHFLGVNRRDHRIGAATLGLEVVPSRPGTVRLEATALRGTLLPLTGFSQGAVNDAEESRGWGLRLAASTPSGRGRLEAGYSRNRFDNPADPLLTQGEDLVQVRPTTEGARYLEAGYDLVPGWAVTPTVQGRLTLAYRHERIDPLYRTVGAFLQADRSNHAVELQAAVGEAALQVLHQRSRDNLDDVPSILTTRGRDLAVTASAPIAFLAGAATRPAWLPILSYRFQRTRQKGDGVPENSDSPASFVPDQVSAFHGLGLDWRGSWWRGAWRIDRSSQDNRQPEREDADHLSWVQTVLVGLTPAEGLDLSLDAALERATNEEADRTDRTRRLGLNLDWRPSPAWWLAARWSRTDADDDAGLRESDAGDLSAQLSRQLDLFRIAGWPLPGQLYVRFGRQTSRLLDREFGVDDARESWTANTGFNFSVL
jgi:hypothetical protein